MTSVDYRIDFFLCQANEQMAHRLLRLLMGEIVENQSQDSSAKSEPIALLTSDIFTTMVMLLFCKDSLLATADNCDVTESLMNDKFIVRLCTIAYVSL